MSVVVRLVTLVCAIGALVTAVVTADRLSPAAAFLLSTLVAVALLTPWPEPPYRGRHATVASIERARKARDDGRCHDCEHRPLRVACPWRGVHPVVCPHPEDRIIRRTYAPRWSLKPVDAIPRCGACGENLHGVSPPENWLDL